MVWLEVSFYFWEGGMFIGGMIRLQNSFWCRVVHTMTCTLGLFLGLAGWARPRRTFVTLCDPVTTIIWNHCILCNMLLNNTEDLNHICGTHIEFAFSWSPVLLAACSWIPLRSDLWANLLLVPAAMPLAAGVDTWVSECQGTP